MEEEEEEEQEDEDDEEKNKNVKEEDLYAQAYNESSNYDTI